MVSPPPSWPSVSGKPAIISRTRGSSGSIPAERILVISSINEIRCWPSILNVAAIEPTPPDSAAAGTSPRLYTVLGRAARVIADRVDATIFGYSHSEGCTQTTSRRACTKSTVGPNRRNAGVEPECSCCGVRHRHWTQSSCEVKYRAPVRVGVDGGANGATAAAAGRLPDFRINVVDRKGATTSSYRPTNQDRAARWCVPRASLFERECDATANIGGCPDTEMLFYTAQ